MAVLTVKPAPGRTGLNFTTNAVAAAAGGDKLPNTGKELVIVENGDASTHTVTIVFPSTAVLDGAVPPNKTVAVPAGSRMIIGPFPAGIYNDTNKQVSFTYDAVTSVKILAFLPV